MPRPRLSQSDILSLLSSGAYQVDLDTGAVYGRSGRLLKSFVGNPEGHLFIRLYDQGKEKTIAVSRLVWMARTRRTIPKNFEIHHQDQNVQNNHWRNLYCLYEDDHRKLHGFDEVPF